ncbi:MAG: IS66 family transposase zinc-finger binding domain-containing protein [Terriglobia bacterium]
MAIDPHQLPNGPAALRQMVLSLLEEVETKDRRLRQLQHWVEQLLRARYGPRRERVNENQLFLFAVALVSAGREAPGEPEASAAPEKAPGGAGKRKGHGRGALPKSLPRQRVVPDLAEDQRKCPQCQGALKRIGEEVSERLEPARPLRPPRGSPKRQNQRTASWPVESDSSRNPHVLTQLRHEAG